MDKVAQYRHVIQQVFGEYAKRVANPGGAENIETQVLMDTKNDHYHVLSLGWEARKRVYYPVFHLDIKNEKIWVQQNVSDYDLVAELMEKGVPQSDIVLAFQSPFLRKYSGFAMA